MTRVNITLPEELYRAARLANLNVSMLARRALTDELARQSKVAELAIYLDELETQHGPISPVERAAADRWADQLLFADRHELPA